MARNETFTAQDEWNWKLDRFYSEEIRSSVADHFDADSGSEKIRYGYGPNFDTDPDPGKKGFSTRKILKI